MNSIDANDLYRLTLKDDGYVFDGALRRFAVREETLKIRRRDGGFAAEKITIRESVHGPVVWDRDGLVLAQRTAALDRPLLLEQYWKMATARNFQEYEAQVKRLQVPTFNITYGDRDGHVMYLFNGTLPKRKHGDSAFWGGIVPGDTSEALWMEIHPYEDLPKVIDPPSGWVQNTNDAPWTTTYPSVLDRDKFPDYTSASGVSFRTLQSLRMLNSDDSITFEELLKYKHSTHLELADRVMDDLLPAVEKYGSADAKRAAMVLKQWDRRTDNESRGALLFQSFAVKLLGPGLNNRQAFAIASDLTRPLTTPHGLKDPAAAVKLLGEAAVETEKAYGALDAAWGDFMRLRSGALDLPGNGATGSLGAFRVLQFTLIPGAGPMRAASVGDTFVACVEFTNTPHAQVLTSYGNSSQPGSPHASDQLALLSAQKLRTAWRSRQEVEAHLQSRDRF